MLRQDGPDDPAGTGQPAGDRRVRHALAAAAALGPFFALDADAAGTGWRPVTDLYRPGSVLLLPGGGRLAEAEPRVAASLRHLGYAARLWSPALGCGLLDRVVPDLAGLRVRDADGGALARLALREPRGWRAADAEQVARLSYQEVVARHLTPLAHSLSGRLSAGLLWGNAASALAGALSVLVAARPDLREPAGTAARVLLSTGPLRGTGQLGVTGTGLGFRRRSCCLFYRVPGGGLCADCGLRRAPGGG